MSIGINALMNTEDHAGICPDISRGSRLVLATTTAQPQLAITYRTSTQAPLQKLQYNLGTLDVKGWKASGSRLSKHKVTQVKLVDTQKVTHDTASVQIEAQ